MNQVTELKIFLASPGDVVVERRIVEEVLKELNITYGNANGISLRLLNWEDYSYPGMGEDPQSVINNQIPNDYDVFLCVFWTRIGTATNRAQSGSVEELEIALSRVENGEDVQIMGYFKTEPPTSLNEITEQFLEVQKLKRKIGKTCLYKEFTSTDKFKEIFRINFTQFLNQRFSSLTKNALVVSDNDRPIEIGNKKRNEIYEKINSINLNIVDTKIDAIDIIESLHEKAVGVSTILSDISLTMNELNLKVTKKANEMEVVNVIKDTRLKAKKRKILANQLANELDVISDKYEIYIPDFKDKYLELVNSFITIYLEYENYISENDKKAKGELLLSIDSCSESLADLLVAMDKVPKLTAKYGQAQIRQMKLLKNLVEEILYGRELLDEIDDENLIEP